MEEKVEKYSMVIPLLLIKKKWFIRNEKELKKSRREVDRVDKSEIVSDRHVFVAIEGREIKEKVPYVLAVVPDHL